MDPTLVAVLMLLATLAMIAVRVPIAIALILPSMVGLSIMTQTAEAGPQQAVATVFEVFSRSSFVIIPLYICIGTLAFETGIATDAFGMAQRWLGKIRGGLGVATSIGSGMFAALTGSSMATVATMAKTALPEMEKAGYSSRISGPTIAATGSVGMLIPPSIILVIYGLLSEQSIGKLLLAGVIPGILTVAINSAVILVLVRRNPDWAPPSRSYPFSERLRWTMKGWPILAVFVVVVGGIYAGLLRPAESAAAGIVTVMLIAVVRRSFKISKTYRALREAVLLSISIGFLLGGAFVLAQMLSLSGITARSLEFITGVDQPPWVILLMILFALFVMGGFLEGTTILALTVPIVVPATMALGYDPIWLGIVMVKMIEVALISPPIGLNVFTLSALVPSIPITTVFRGIVPFIIGDFVVIALIAAFPVLVLGLPQMAMG